MKEPATPEALRLANIASVEIIRRLWEDWGVDQDGWGSRKGEVDLYSINVPLVAESLKDPKVYFTRVWRNNCSFPSSILLFLLALSSEPTHLRFQKDASLFKPLSSTTTERTVDPADPPEAKQLVFHFKPDMQGLINPLSSTVPVGTDTWAINQGYISVCPLRAW